MLDHFVPGDFPSPPSSAEVPSDFRAPPPISPGLSKRLWEVSWGEPTCGAQQSLGRTGHWPLQTLAQSSSEAAAGLIGKRLTLPLPSAHLVENLQEMEMLLILTLVFPSWLMPRGNCGSKWLK